MSFRDCNAQYSEILDCQSSLFILSIIGVFIFSILVYSQRGSIYAASVILLQTLRQEQFYITQRFYIMDFTSWIYMGFISFTSQLERIIIDYLTKSAHFILFKMGQFSEVLAVFFYQQTSGQYYLTLSAVIYSRSAECQVFSLPFSRFVRTALNYSYLDWYNPRFYHFCVHLPFIKILRKKFL